MYESRRLPLTYIILVTCYITTRYTKLIKKGMKFIIQRLNYIPKFLGTKSMQVDTRSLEQIV